ncbi:MAG: TIGR04551 family protein [Myxococcales bacterium]|nr:TIGR04551 family protein [Myxococcales bacterium]
MALAGRTRGRTRFFSLLFVTAGLAVSGRAAAQATEPPPDPPPDAPPSEAPAAPDEAPGAPPAETAAEGEASDDAGADASPAEAEAAEGEPESPAEPAPSLTAPSLAPEASEPASTEILSPADMQQRLAESAPPSVRVASDWTAPTPVLTLHGYMRMRGELMDTFWLGRRTRADITSDSDIDQAVIQRLRNSPDPFTRFRPLENRAVAGGNGPAGLACADESRNNNGTCDISTVRFANLRLRLSPQLNLSEDVRVKMTFDVLDNFVAGEPPASFYGAGPGVDADGNGDPDGIDTTRTFANTVDPRGGAGLGETVRARRAWAEVRRRDLGELRFGRMPQHWGLGMLYNAGNGLDDDLSTDVDRLMGITNLFGLYLTASYDFLAEGLFDPADPVRPLEQSQLDDLDQATFSLSRRHTAEELAKANERGDLVLNGGLQLTIRDQASLYALPASPDDSPLVEVEASTYTTDLWALLRYRFLRVELEAAWTTGSMNDIVGGSGKLDIDQFGYALETEIRLVDDKLGLYLDHGLATGDEDVEGLSSDADFVSQVGGDGNRTISTFRFHPSYRVDLILWRNIMRQVTGAMYFKPGISYDFIRGNFGQVFGARLDVLYSRATAPLQTWGNDADLGIELNGTLYFRTEDGPDLVDGYHTKLQYGVLFPMRGLGYDHADLDLDTAQTLRLLLGVVF